MGRIPKAYLAQLRELLQRAHARRLERGIELILAKARYTSSRAGISLSNSLKHVHDRLAAHPYFQKRIGRQIPDRFFCDAGLGGLARWLRAAGHEAMWEPDIDDEQLLRAAHQCRAAILTTDSMLMERRILRDGIISALWLPPTMSIAEQLSIVVREFGLSLRSPRCMTCGGELVRQDKEKLRDRIPPRTYRWLDEYFVCSKCDKLFWHGTHWQRIRRELETVARSCGGVCSRMT